MSYNKRFTYLLTQIITYSRVFIAVFYGTNILKIAREIREL